MKTIEMDFAKVPFDTRNICAKQLCPLDMELHYLTFSCRKDVIVGLCCVIIFQKKFHTNFKRY